MQLAVLLKNMKSLPAIAPSRHSFFLHYFCFDMISSVVGRIRGVGLDKGPTRARSAMCRG